jgi:DNA-binding NarL/FixJ family response regulator
MKPTLMIVDDHKLFNNGLKEILSDDFEVVAQVFDGKLVMNIIEELLPQIILMDINLPHRNGLDLGKEIKLKFKKIKLVFITMYNEDSFLKQAKELKADGYLLKDSDSDELIASLKSVLDGKTIFDTKLSPFYSNVHHDDFFVKEFSLSKREIEIIRLLKNGKTSEEISNLLFVSYETIKSHRKNIYFKLGIASVAELIQFAIDKGI